MSDQTPAYYVVIYTADDWTDAVSGDRRPLISSATWAKTPEEASHRIVNARQGRSALNTVGPFTDQTEAESYRRTWARAQGQATIAGLLTVTADLIQTNGLHTGPGWFAETAGLSPAQSPLSVYGAMNVAFGADPDDTRGTRDGLSSADTARALSEHLGMSALEWSQEPGRTQAEVLNALHACASAMLDAADRTKSSVLPSPDLIGDEEPAVEATAQDLGVSAYPHTEWIVTVHPDDEEGDPGARAGSILSTPSLETFMDQLRDAGLTTSIDRGADGVTYASAIAPTGYIRLRRPNPGEVESVRVTPIRSGADVESEGWSAGEDFDISFTAEPAEPAGRQPAPGRYRIGVLPMSTGTVYGVRDVALNVVLSDAFGAGYGAWTGTREAAESAVSALNAEWLTAGGWNQDLYFDPDSTITVDAGNGSERWNGRRWNRYVTDANRHGNMINVRILSID